MNTPAVEMVTITTVYDNYEFNPELKTAWGFSCLVEVDGKTILFDAGGDGNVLLHNMEKLKIDPQKIEIAFLSHIHEDHTGGFFSLLERNSNLTVYLPQSFPRSFKKRIETCGAKFVEVNEAIEISQGAFSTGEMGSDIKEQSLILQTKEGPIIITGCAHPGVISIIEKSMKIAGGSPFLVMGGFHLLRHTPHGIQEIVERFNELCVKQVAPSHCTGGAARDMFRSSFGENFIENGVGRVVNVGREMSGGQ